MTTGIVRVFSTFDQAVASCQPESSVTGILVLMSSRSYPWGGVVVNQQQLDNAYVYCKGTRIFIEYATEAGDEYPPPTTVTSIPMNTRLVLATDNLAAYGLPRNRILTMHGGYAQSDYTCNVTAPPRPGQKVGNTFPSLVVAARVAGYDTAVYGLPDCEDTIPIIVPITNELLISTVRMSAFQTGRYAPRSAWELLWNWVFSWLRVTERLPQSWYSDVMPTYTLTSSIPSSAGRMAIQRSLQHLTGTGRIMYSEMVGTGSQDILGHCPVRRSSIPLNATCIDEGFDSTIHINGSQFPPQPLPVECQSPGTPGCSNTRTDDNAMVALGIAAGAQVVSQPMQNISLALALLNYIYFASPAQMKGQSMSDGSMGLVCWYTNTWFMARGPMFYGDNDGLVLISTAAAGGFMRRSTWDVSILRQAFGNVRTTGVHGFRPAATIQSEMAERGWQYYFMGVLKEGDPGTAPRYQASLWAAFAWAYEATGLEIFTNRSLEGVRRLMKVYPMWRWTHYMSQEVARILLPLAWLYRVKPSSEISGWIDTIAGALIDQQRPSGAIAEWLGPDGLGATPPPSSNGKYATAEGGVLQSVSDPVADVRTTQNFAFVALREAGMATGRGTYMEAAERLGNFLLRVQTRSSQLPRLDGTWFRAFDVEKWDYWGSGNDITYGPWSAESGWSTGFITAGLATRHMSTSLWEAARQRAQVIRASPELVEDTCKKFLPPTYCLVV